MEMISFLTIPVNTAIIYFTGNSRPDNLSGESPLTVYLKKRSDLWSQANIILLVVCIEHALILIKIGFVFLINDTPALVLAAERLRTKVEELADRSL